MTKSDTSQCQHHILSPKREVLPDFQPKFGAFVCISFRSFVQAKLGAFVRIFI
jgi:hypothetical protein